MQVPDFWQNDRMPARLLDPLGRLVGLVGAVRRRLVRSKALPAPVICVGNLTVGGAGKTPTAIALARQLQAMGGHPFFLTRGYGGQERGPLLVDPAHHRADEVGDEALLLAAVAPCVVSRDRVRGGVAAIEAGAGLVILDDGYQNPHLVYDLTLVVVDGAIGFGNQRLLPAGPLRETVRSGLARADALVLIGEDQRGHLQNARPPILRAHLCPSPQAPDLRGTRVVAFAGIGRPSKFFQTLRQEGAELVRAHAFPDHHRYKPSEIEAILAESRQVDAVCVTTEKDHVRLPLKLRNYVKKLPIELRFESGNLLERLVSGVRCSRGTI